MSRILIIKLSSLGDLFHALPSVRALKAGLNAQIDWVTQPEYVDLVKCFDDVENIYPFPRQNLRTQLIPFLKNLRKQNYDYVIDLQGLMKSAVIAAGAKASRKIGPSANREGAHLLYKETAGKKNKNRHAAEELLDVVKYLNLPMPDPLEFPVTFPGFPDPGKGIHIAFAPCSRAAGKDWPYERFIETGKALLKNESITIHLIGGPNDRERCQKIVSALGERAINHAGETTLLELGGLLKRMNLLLTVDSGPMHMGAAVGIPVLALFGPTSPLRTGPYGKQHRIVESTFDGGQKKISKKVREQDMRYIEAILASNVITQLNDMI